MKNLTPRSFYFLLILITISSCNKEDIGTQGQSTFLTTYEHLGSNKNAFRNTFTLSNAIETATGDLVSVGTAYISPDAYLVVLKTDANGNKLWTKTYKLLRWLDTNIWNIIEMPDGSYFINSRRTDEILRLNADGEEMYHTTFIDDWLGSSVLEATSMPYIEDDGTMYLSCRYQRGNYYKLVSIDDNGSTIVLQQYNSSNYLASLYINIVKAEGDTAWYVQTSVASQSPIVHVSLLTKTWQADLSDDPTYDYKFLSTEQDQIDGISIYPLQYFSGPQRFGDEIITLLAPVPSFSVSLYYPTYLGFDFCRTKLDLTTYPELVRIGNNQYSYTPNAYIKSQDGGYYICGMVNSGLSSERPFLIKLNSDLETVFEKYDYAGNLRFNHISQCEDGTLLVCGYAKDMGQGNDKKDKRYLLCRLNPDGTL